MVRLRLATHRIHIVTASRYFGLSERKDRLASQGWAESRSSTSWRVFRNNPNFRRYFAGSVTSDFGTWLQNTAQVLLAYRLSHSVVVVGMVTCAQFSSPLVLGPWAGVLTDRFGGRRTLLATQLTAAAFACSMAALLFIGPINEWWLGCGAVASGLAFTFALPARNVTVRRLVPEKDVEPAFAMDSVSYNLGRAAAPPVSVLIVTTLGFGWAFAANAASFVAFAACLMLAKGRPSQRLELGGRRKSELKDGFVAARRNWKIAVLLLMVAAVTMADDPVQVLGPALANHLHVAASWSGWFIAALGAGTVVGSFRRSRHNPSLPLTASALGALAACMVLFVMSPVAWGSLAAAFGAGIACLTANSATRTLLAKHAGREKEASVMAVWAIAWAGSKPLASLTDGLLAGSVGLRWAGLLLAVPALVPFTVLVWLMISILVMRRWKPQPGSWLGRAQSRLESMEWYRRAEHHLLRSHVVPGQERELGGTTEAVPQRQGDWPRQPAA